VIAIDVTIIRNINTSLMTNAALPGGKAASLDHRSRTAGLAAQKLKDFTNENGHL
jgi:hypothetical protein